MGLLVESGANVNAVDNEMRSAFIVAIDTFYGISKYVKSLWNQIVAYADHMSAILGHSEAAELLWQSGTNVSAVHPRYYNDLLNWAAKTGN